MDAEPHRDGISASAERARLERAARLHWLHWAVVAASTVLTLLAWRLSSSQIEERIETRFDREVSQVVELISERMQRYEDALWSGVGVVRADRDGVDHAEWRRFAAALSLGDKYPGINGIGVIYHVGRPATDSFLAEQRRSRPDFTIHPAHTEPELLPITYIEPVEPNRQAVGLDMAHEANRYAAARGARDTATAQITGPIVLVQDAERTPGFLFFAPFYDGGVPTDVDERRARFGGAVYAPFIVQKLMEGTLARDRRHVDIAIVDGGTPIFDEHVEDDAQLDPDPLFTASRDVPMYGRTWRFDIRTDRSFREQARNHQPTAILLGGMVIDALLLSIFVLLTRANRKAIEFADLAHRELIAKATQLERSNADLAQFAHAASHDLREPIRMVASYAQLLDTRLSRDDREAAAHLAYIRESATRMGELVSGLLDYARLDSDEPSAPRVITQEVVAAVVRDLELAIEESGARVTVEQLPDVRGSAAQIRQVFQNLLANALKFRGDAEPTVRIFAEPEGGHLIRFGVTDDGIGIDPTYFDRIFTVFKRLHVRERYPGSGMGLAICKRIVLRHGGTIWVSSNVGKGATFYFTLPRPADGETGGSA